MKRPDLILTNARIRTMDPANPRAEALAVADGALLAVGSAADVAALAGPGTRVVDLHGRAVMPGMIDSHTHGLWGASRDLLEVYTGLGTPHDELLEAVAARVRETPPGKWIVGGHWITHTRPDLGAHPAELLDRVSPDNPVALRDTTMHSAWVNGAALRAAGISAETEDPLGGEIERDADGRPTGILREVALSLIMDFIKPPVEDHDRAVDRMFGHFNAMGLTGFKEPMAFETELAAYARAEDEGRLSAHIAAHLSRQSPMDESFTPMVVLADWRQRYRRPHIHTDFAKLFIDGVAPSRTAAFVDPYAGDDPATHDPEAMLILKPDVLAAEVTALDAAGFVVKMHAVGDRAVQAGLDAIEAARAANGPSGLRHEIAHLPFVREEDTARFAALDAVAEVSPKIWYPNPVTAGQRAVLGLERAERSHRIRDLLEAGANVVYGSDWPASAPDANPWTSLAGMMTRRDPLGRYPGSVGAGQAIDLETALPLFTVNGAKAMGLGHRTGALRAGLSADLLVLEKPLEDLPPEEIAAIDPVATVFEGREVYGGL